MIKRKSNKGEYFLKSCKILV